jgi:hypothetical protein
MTLPPGQARIQVVGGGGAAGYFWKAVTSCSQKAGRSSGLRLVTSTFGPALQTCTSVSTQVPPALLISVCRLGHEVRVRPRTRSASTSVHGPWQMTAAGFARLEHRPGELHGRGHSAQLVRAGHAAGQDQPVVAGRVGVVDGLVHREGVALVQVVERLSLPGLRREEPAPQGPRWSR